MKDLSLKVQEFNKKRNFNRWTLFLFSLFSFCLAVYAFVNDDKDNLFEYVFFFMVAIFSITNFFWLTTKKLISPDNPDLKNTLAKEHESSVRNTYFIFLGYLQPLVLGDFSIIVFELRNSIYFFPLLVILALSVTFLIFRTIKFRNYAEKCYDDLMGRKLITLFP